jgi:hypothetical protein
MKFETPLPLQAEHEGLRTRLAAAALEAGAVGEAAREVARLVQAHFQREEEFALRPLGILTQVSQGEITRGMAEVLPLTRKLKAELTHLLADHARIASALDHLRATAHVSGKTDYDDLAQDVVQHLRNEEQVLYPAALMVGDLVAQSLSS